jgi:hypothetical protein
MGNFNSVPQRRAVNYNALWTQTMLTRKAGQPPSKTIAANRAKIDQLEELVRRGQIQPREVPMGQLKL